MSAVAVLDIGKTNVKLSVTDADGTVRETLTTPNTVRPGPPYRHHDVIALEAWAIEALADLARRHAIGAIVPIGHGSAGVLVDDAGPVMPMIDYEDEPPAAVTALYRKLAGDYRTRGSPIMLGASHIARQMLWLETGWPEAFARARHFLGLPQYWAWRLSGVAASEASVARRAVASVVGARRAVRADRRRARTGSACCRRFAPAWAALGPLRPELAARHGLSPRTEVLCGAHDSTVNFYRYQAAGLSGITRGLHRHLDRRRSATPPTPTRWTRRAA